MSQNPKDPHHLTSTTSLNFPPSTPSLGNMNTSRNVSQVITWILNQLSIRGLRVLLELETQFPMLESVTSSSERLEFFTEIINMACGTSYSKNMICAIHNVIVMNDLIRQELLHKVDVNELISQYKSSGTTDSMQSEKYSINVRPFTNVCVNPSCLRQSLNIEFSKSGHIVKLNSMQACSIYTGVCKNCKCIYGPSSIIDTHVNQRIITMESIRDIDYVHFSGDLVYSREMLSMFTHSLIHAHMSFEGFAETYISTLDDLGVCQTATGSANTFAKRLEVVWLYYELSRFAFVTSCETSIVFPRSFEAEARSKFIEQNLPFFSHVFAVFWSNHRLINGIKCREDLCSRVMLIDGHQKCRRLVCQFENVTNLSHPEMGPVIQGCPYAPMRKKKNEEKDHLKLFCSHHAKFMEKTDNDQQFYTSEYKEARQIDQKVMADLDNDDMCNVYRSEIGVNQKNRSFGLLVTFLSCHVVVGFIETIQAEGCRRVTDHLLTLLKYGANLPDALIYDNACALRLHWNKVYDTKYLVKNEFTTKLYNLALVLDRFHRKGHTRPMCRKMMNPDDIEHGDRFKNINTSVCEQFFSFLTKFRSSLRGFNYPTSTLFSLLLFHLKNCSTTGIKANSFQIGQRLFADQIKSHFISRCVFESVDLDLCEKQKNSIQNEGEEK